MRNKRGTGMITLGLLLILSAGGLTAYNLAEAHFAGREAQQALEAFDFLLTQEREETHAEEKGSVSDRTALPVMILPSATEEPAVMQPLPHGEEEAPSAQPAPSASPEVGNTPETVPTETAAPETDDMTTQIWRPDLSAAETAAANTPQPSPTPEATSVPPLYFPEVNYDEIEIPDYILNPNMDMPVKETNGQSYIGVLEIPALELTLPVISEWNYARLKKAPCRYAGSAYTDDLVIAAHNYKEHFGKLKQLKPGSRVVFTDTVGNQFNYCVVLTETLMPDDVREMKSAEFDLSLFTCTVGGSYRVTVRCDRIP